MARHYFAGLMLSEGITRLMRDDDEDDGFDYRLKRERVLYCLSVVRLIFDFAATLFIS